MTDLIRLAIHGGAGDAAKGADTRVHEAALREIAAAGAAMLKAGRSALDTVEHCVMQLEECPLFNAGVGAVLNRDGAPELDAAIMNGADRACGAVAGISRVKSPIQLARAVMERTPHVLFTGAGAEALARELRLPEVTPDHFVTEERFHQLKDARRRGIITLDHDDTTDIGDAPRPDGEKYGTVGAVARDQEGHLAAATSTGGLTNKHPGRIGDTPIPGVGTFADDATVALSCTGTGESFIRTCFGYHVHARMAFANDTLAQACESALAEVRRFAGRGGCIAIGRDGAIALPFNSRVMFRAWFDESGEVRVAVG